MPKKRKIYNNIMIIAIFFTLFGLGFWGENVWKEESFQTMSEIKEEKDSVSKKAYLTFDDGPSDNTEKILDILKEKNVKATFFVVGREGENAKKIYQRILAEGNTLGLHSYSHDYDKIYSSIEEYKKDLDKLRKYLKQVTGREIKFYRFPGGSSNSIAKIDLAKCAKYLRENGITYYDWNALNNDAVCFKNTPEILNKEIMKDVKGKNTVMILMHDLHECTTTVDALPSLIDELKTEGYDILPITDKTKPIQHKKFY
ncbi:MAG: polysaccharide deacetylase family protein [Lachnospiraceae bacterium]